MATKLLKYLSRECMRLCDRQGRLMIVTLEPGDMISFRAKGTRKSYEVPLGQCLALAEILEIESSHRAAVAQYKERKKAGFSRLRKPRKPTRIFSKFYYTTLGAKPKKLEANA